MIVFTASGFVFTPPITWETIVESFVSSLQTHSLALKIRTAEPYNTRGESSTLSQFQSADSNPQVRHSFVPIVSFMNIERFPIDLYYL